jgi:hypothetical protein
VTLLPHVVLTTWTTPDDHHVKASLPALDLGAEIRVSQRELARERLPAQLLRRTAEDAARNVLDLATQALAAAGACSWPPLADSVPEPPPRPTPRELYELARDAISSHRVLVTTRDYLPNVAGEVIQAELNHDETGGYLQVDDGLSRVSVPLKHVTEIRRLPRVTAYSGNDICPGCKCLPDERHLPGCGYAAGGGGW